MVMVVMFRPPVASGKTNGARFGGLVRPLLSFYHGSVWGLLPYRLLQRLKHLPATVPAGSSLDELVWVKQERVRTVAVDLAWVGSVFILVRFLHVRLVSRQSWTGREPFGPEFLDQRFDRIVEDVSAYVEL